MLRYLGILGVLLGGVLPTWAVRQDLATPATVDTVTVKVDSGTEQVVFSVGTSPSVTTPTTRTAFAAGWSTGVVVNDASRAAVDFRVESDNGDSAFFVDAGGDSLFSEIRIHLRRRTLLDSLAIAHSSIPVGWAGGSSANQGAAARLRFGVLIYPDSVRTDSLTVDGDATIGDDLGLISTGAILSFGPSTDVTLTHAANTLTMDGGDLTLTDNTKLTLGTGGDVDLSYNGTNTVMDLRVVGTGNLLLNNGLVIIGDGTTTTAANITLGLVLDQRGNDDYVLMSSSSDVGHAMTGQTPATVYGGLKKYQATSGGLQISGLKDGDGAAGGAVLVQAMLGEAADATKTTGGVGIVLIDTYVTDGGTGVANPAADANMVGFRQGGTTRFILDADGDSHQDVGTAWTNFDGECDALLARSVGIVMDPESIVRGKFDDFNRQHKEEIIRVGLIPRLTPEQEARGERPLMNTTQLLRLHNGAIWQGYVRDQEIAERMAQIERITAPVESHMPYDADRLAALEAMVKTQAERITYLERPWWQKIVESISLN